jgi:hypothetical protein
MKRIDLLAIRRAVALLVVIVELVWRRALSERYSLLWLLTGAVFLDLSSWRVALDCSPNGLRLLPGKHAVHRAPRAALAAPFGGCSRAAGSGRCVTSLFGYLAI